MNKAALCATTSVLAMMSLSSPARAGSSDWAKVAAWEMNEHKHATTLHDAVGNLDGHVGSRTTPSGTFHSFPREDKDGVYPQHVDTVPDNPALDPGNDDFAVEVRFTWPKTNDKNLIQKGQGDPAGGMFNMKTTVPAAGQPEGYIKCLFRGDAGDSQVESYAAPKLNDGAWHTVRCQRTSAGTAMWVDGTKVDTNDNDSGVISNDWPIAIGGNTVCEDTPTENNICNYWFGTIGYVRWWTK
jgi:hypothetical protein